MAKIFIFGERIVDSNLGYLSIDEGKEIKIKASSSGVTSYECEIPTGTHVIQFSTSGKFKRGLANSGGIGGAINASQIGSFEREVTFGKGDVLMLKVVEKVTSANVEYQMSNEDEYMKIFESESQKKKSSGCGCFGWYVIGSIVALALIYTVWYLIDSLS